MKNKHYLIYQITNNVNGMIYIGKHETFNVDDNYFGSGKYLKRAIKKYGLENFTKTILIELQNLEELNLLEKMVVTPEFCARKDTYNILEGGHGGWNGISTYESQVKGGNSTFSKFKKRGLTIFLAWKNSISPEEFDKKFSAKIRESYKSGNRRKPCRYSMTGNHTIFICNYALHKTIRVEKDSALYYEYIAEGWIRGQLKQKQISNI